MSKKQLHLVTLNDEEYSEYLKKISCKDQESLHKIDFLYSSMIKNIDDIYNDVDSIENVINHDISNDNVRKMLKLDWYAVNDRLMKSQISSFNSLIKHLKNKVHDFLIDEEG